MTGVRLFALLSVLPAWLTAQTSPQSPPSPSSVLATTDHSSWVAAATSDVAPLQRKVALDLRHLRLRDAIDTLARQAQIPIGYSGDVARSSDRVSLHVEGMLVRDALARLLEGTGFFAYVSLDGRQALVRRPFVIAALPVQAQGSGTISGDVRDSATGASIPQVAIRVDGTAMEVNAGSDGRYRITGMAAGEYRVTARRVGYIARTRVVTIAESQSVTLNFLLNPPATRLDEVVTTAVGEQRRYQVGNVIATVNVDSIAPTAPVTSVTDILTARVPGLDIVETGGLTGSGEAIRIRGQSSLVLASDPIIIIDGIRQDNSAGGTQPTRLFSTSDMPSPSRINDIDFSQIETIDVLKGPAASTEYGTNAANGVIVITTKRGTSGHPQWQASAEQTESNVPEKFPDYYYSWGHASDGTGQSVECPVYSVFSFLKASTEGECVTDSVTAFNPLNVPAYSEYGTGARTKYNLSVGGGSEGLRYYVAGGLSNETGIARLPQVFASQALAVGFPQSALDPNSENQRSIRTNMFARLGATADLSADVAYMSTYHETPSLSLAVANTVVLPDSAHSYGYGYASHSPIADLGAGESQNTDALTGGLTTNWRPTPWLAAHATVGIDHESMQVDDYLLPQASLFSEGSATAYSGAGLINGTNDIYSVDLRATASAPLSQRLRSVSSVGLQLVDGRMEGVSVYAMGLSPSNLTLNGAVNPNVTQQGSRAATLGGYGEEQLNIADRLFLTGALRVDAGSGFGSSYTFVAYPKASASWLVVSSGPTTVRLRGALGEAGVQPPNGSSLLTYQTAIQWINGSPVSVAQVSQPGNPDLKPERSTELEGGANVTLFAGRVSLEITQYSKTTQDALVNVPLGWDFDNQSYEANIGEVQNGGTELSLTATPIQSRVLTWTATLNAAINHNKLVHLEPGVGAQILCGDRCGLQEQQVGYPLFGYWGTRSVFTDANHDGLVEPSELTVDDSASYEGSSLPTRTGSVATHIGLWRETVTLSGIFDYHGGYRLFDEKADVQAVYGTLQEQNDVLAPLWMQARVASLPFASYPSGFFEDGTMVRFRELSLTYTLPARWSHVLKTHSMSLSAAVRNLALWTRYSGPDPEVATGDGGSDIREDFGATPLARYWVLRLNIGL